MLTAIPDGVCDLVFFGVNLVPMKNIAGYVFCGAKALGIKQLCPPGTKVDIGMGGCANKTTNTSVLPPGSRCTSQPCQNGGLCVDFSSVDAYYCLCEPPYTGRHCEVQEQQCPNLACGHRTSEIQPLCPKFTSDMALNYACSCYIISPSEDMVLALNNCQDKDQLFNPNCSLAEPVGAVPYTNKGFYICPGNKFTAFVKPCPLNHVWNNTRKECIRENI